MSSKSIKKNYLLNMIYQVFLLIVPIVVTPYLSRVLTEVGSGQYSYTFSITTYFTLFAALGFGYYGQRLVAGHQNDKIEQSKDFWEIFIARTIPVSIALAVYILLIFLGVYGYDYTYLMIIMSINIIAVLFDITYFFQGNEEFGKIVIRNIVIKFISIISIFIFVKSQDDLWLYTLIQSLTVLCSNLSLWVYVRKFLCKISLSSLSPLKHLKPTLLLFIPTIAISVYTTLDKTLIGVLVPGVTEIIQPDGTTILRNISDIENGNYEYSEKLVKMAMTVVTSLGTVMIPRNSNRFAEKDYEGIKNNIEKSCSFVFMLAVPMTLGCICVASNLMPWYLGEGYSKAANLMMILAVLIIIIGISNVFGLQFLIPSKQDKKFIISVTVGAAVNLSLNLILIPVMYSYGAAIATVIGELVVTFLCVFFSRKYVSFGNIVRKSRKSFVSGLIMFIPCFILKIKLDSSVLNTVIIILTGIVVYFVSLIVLRDSLIIQTLFKIREKTRKIIHK